MLEYFLTFLLLFIITFSISRLLKFRAKGTVLIILIVEAAFITAACLTADLGSVVIDFCTNVGAWFDSVLKQLKLK